MVIDARFINPCANARVGLKCADNSDAEKEKAVEAAKRLQPEDSMDTMTTTTKLSNSSAVDLDEGFFDKNVASPASGASLTSALSGTSSPPPDVVDEDDEDEVDDDEDAAAAQVVDDEMEEEIDDDETPLVIAEAATAAT